MMNHSKTFGGIRHPAGRKALALLLAALMTLSTAAPAFADLFAFVEVEEEKPVYTEGVLTAYENGYEVKVTYGADAQIPENAVLEVVEIPEGTLQYEAYYGGAQENLAEDEEAVFARFFDLSIKDAEGNEVTPAAPVAVEISASEMESTEKVAVVTPAPTAEDIVEGALKAAFGEKNLLRAEAPAEGVGRLDASVEADVYDAPADAEEVPEMETVAAEPVDNGTVSFVAENGLSVVGVVGTDTITTRVITAGGEAYDVYVTFDKEAGIPETAELYAEEIEDQSIVDAAKKALGGGVVRSSHLFDIKILNEGSEVTPLTPVEVRIEVAEEIKGTSEVATVHFHGEEEPAVIESKTETIQEWLSAVTFETDGFSIFAVIVIDKEEGEFVVEDENYKVTISYTKEAEIPLGTDLIVREVEFDSNEYWDLWNKTVNKLNEDIGPYNELEGDQRKGITDVVFFDVSLKNGENEIEPAVPLQVKIEYLNDNGIYTPEGESNGVIHFASNETELITDVETFAEEGSSIVTGYTYSQDGFSPVGTYSTGEYIDPDLPIREPLEPFEAPMAIGGVRALADEPVRAGEEGIRMSASKHLDPNGDGTSTLHLTLTGQADSQNDAQVPKVNVVLVVDTSGSMGGNVDLTIWGSATPVTAQQAFENAEGTSSNTNGNRSWVTEPKYYNGSRNRIYPVRLTASDGSYSYVWRNGTNWNATDYTGTVYKGGTRLDATKEALYTLVDALLANNKPGESVTDKDGNVISLADITEITLIDFSGNSNYNGATNINDATVHNPRKATTAGSVTQSNTLKGQINSLSASGGTNWEAALRRAKTVADEDYGSQTGEQTVIIFVTDGMPTFYLNNANSRTAGNGGTGGEERDNVHNAWTYAADDARALNTAGYDLYSIFAYGADSTGFNNDGNRKPNDYLEALQNYYDTGTGNYTNTADNANCFNATNTTQLQEALKKIANMINNLTAFGAVDVHDGVSFGATNSKLLLDNGTLDPNSLTYNVTGAEDADCFTVRMENGVPVFKIGQTNPVTVNGTINNNKKVPNPEAPNDRTQDLTCTVWTCTYEGKTYEMCPAKLYTETNGERQGIEWDLTGIGLIEDGMTYDLSFLIWPNQTAYDLVAALENGEITEAQATAQYPEIWPYISKTTNSDGSVTYSLATNWEQNVTYYQVDKTTQGEGDNQTVTYTYNQQEPMPLEAGVTQLARTSMVMEKRWNDTLDDSQLRKLMYNEDGSSKKYQVYLRLYMDDNYADIEAKYHEAGNNYKKRFTLGWNEEQNDYVWADEYAVAPGVMVKEGSPAATNLGLTKESHVGYDIAKYNGEYYFILEKGHYYAVTEENIDDHFILEEHIFHPMVVDSITQDVTFSGILADDPYGAINVTGIVPMNSIFGTNTLRGGINIRKEVRDQNNNLLNTDKVFEATVTMNAPKDRNGNVDLSNLDSYYEDNTLVDSSVAWYIYVDENGNRQFDPALIEAGILEDSGQVDQQYNSKIGTGLNHPADKYSYYGSGYFMLDFDNTTGVLEGQVKLSTKYSIRFVNMATNTTYNVVETNKQGMVDSYTYSHTTMVHEDPEDPDSPLIPVTTEDEGVADHKVEGNQENNVLVTNKTKACKIEITKIGDWQTTTTLKDVEFELYSDAACTEQIIRDDNGNELGTPTTTTDPDTGKETTTYDHILKTDQNGKIVIECLTVGKYYLKEITPAIGYNMLSDVIEFEIVEENGTFNVIYQTSNTNFNQNPGAKYELKEIVTIDEQQQEVVVGYGIYVNNESGKELPHTGSNSVIAYTIAGVAMVTTVGAVLHHRKKEEE